MQTTTNVIDKNWKALIKPNKLESPEPPSN